MSKLGTILLLASIMVAIFYYNANKWNESLHFLPHQVKIINAFGFVNSYLYKLPKTDKYILIDTLVEGKEEYILENIKKHGIDPSQIALIYHTHKHSDHTGSTAGLLKSIKTDTYIHPSEVEFVQSGLLQEMPMSTIRVLNLTRQYLGKYLPKQKTAVFSITKDLILNQDILELGGIKILHTPGHTSGHTSLVTSDGFCFIGDLMSGGLVSLDSPSYPWFYEMDLETIKQNIISISKEKCNRIYVGHGLPFTSTSLQEWIANEEK